VCNNSNNLLKCHRREMYIAFKPAFPLGLSTVCCMNSEEKLALPSLDTAMKPTAAPHVTYLQLIMIFLL
jgi:hypothetical protein